MRIKIRIATTMQIDEDRDKDRDEDQIGPDFLIPSSFHAERAARVHLYSFPQ
jgi:hypothetical protein